MGGTPSKHRPRKVHPEEAKKKEETEEKAKVKEPVSIYDQNTPSPLKNTTGKFPDLIGAIQKEGAFGKPGIMRHLEKIFNKPKYNKNHAEYNKEKLQELLNKKDMEGRTALDWANIFRRPDIVKYLENKREEVEETKNPGSGRRGGSRTRRKGKK